VENVQRPSAWMCLTLLLTAARLQDRRTTTEMKYTQTISTAHFSIHERPSTHFWPKKY